MTFLFLALAVYFVLLTGIVYVILVEWHYEEHFCKIILNFGQGLRGCCLKIFLLSPLAGILFSKEQFVHFGRGHYEGTFL